MLTQIHAYTERKAEKRDLSVAVIVYPQSKKMQSEMHTSPMVPPPGELDQT